MALPAVSQRGLTALLYPDFFVLCLIFGVSCSACYFLFPKFWKQANSEATMPMRQLGAFCLFAFLYLGIAFYVLSFPGYVDPVEPMVVSASYFAVHGPPVYDMLISYGPFCFLFYGAAMKLFWSYRRNAEERRRDWKSGVRHASPHSLQEGLELGAPHSWPWQWSSPPA